MNTKLLLPHQFKKTGWLLLIPSALFGMFILIFDFEFSFLDAKAFTIYNHGFIDPPTIFGLINVNYTPTISGFIFLVGAILVAFSKEKHEDEFIANIRLASLVWATYVNYAILAFCFLFFYNFQFGYVMLFNMFTILIFFILRFYYSIYKTRKVLRHEE